MSVLYTILYYKPTHSKNQVFCENIPPLLSIAENREYDNNESLLSNTFFRGWEND